MTCYHQSSALPHEESGPSVSLISLTVRPTPHPNLPTPLGWWLFSQKKKVQITSYSSTGVFPSLNLSASGCFLCLYIVSVPPRPYIVPRGKRQRRLDQHPDKSGHSYICIWFQFFWVLCSVLPIQVKTLPILVNSYLFILDILLLQQTSYCGRAFSMRPTLPFGSLGWYQNPNICCLLLGSNMCTRSQGWLLRRLLATFLAHKVLLESLKAMFVRNFCALQLSTTSIYTV